MVIEKDCLNVEEHIKEIEATTKPAMSPNKNIRPSVKCNMLSWNIDTTNIDANNPTANTNDQKVNILL